TPSPPAWKNRPPPRTRSAATLPRRLEARRRSHAISPAWPARRKAPPRAPATRRPRRAPSTAWPESSARWWRSSSSEPLTPDAARSMRPRRRNAIPMQDAIVIDDSRAIRMILSRALQRLGFEPLQAANGEEALAILEQRRDSIRLALVDWNMPGMSGLEFIRTVRADSRNSSLVLIMVTTETEIDQMTTALESGANEYVMKPFTDEIIADKIRMTGLECAAGVQ